MNLKPESNALKRPTEKSHENFQVVPAWVRRPWARGGGHGHRALVSGAPCRLGAGGHVCLRGRPLSTHGQCSDGQEWTPAPGAPWRLWGNSDRSRGRRSRAQAHGPPGRRGQAHPPMSPCPVGPQGVQTRLCVRAPALSPAPAAICPFPRPPAPRLPGPTWRRTASGPPEAESRRRRVAETRPLGLRPRRCVLFFSRLIGGYS